MVILKTFLTIIFVAIIAIFSSIVIDVIKDIKDQFTSRTQYWVVAACGGLLVGILTMIGIYVIYECITFIF